ncbi:GLPGLI family protein, partial [Porphyromonas sp.]|uniref:GLPGLI family protein n=1 Tax=Porphyromonas sp. TaxID=1924944 RepID=UPI001CB63E81
SYEAWFTPSIPISAGPNFFGGLPGLILELHSMDGAHHFVLDALCQRSADIVEWKIPLLKSVSRSQFRDYYQRLHKHPIQTFEAEALSWTIPFNPIELE